MYYQVGTVFYSLLFFFKVGLDTKEGRQQNKGIVTTYRTSVLPAHKTLGYRRVASFGLRVMHIKGHAVDMEYVLFGKEWCRYVPPPL